MADASSDRDFLSLSLSLSLTTTKEGNNWKNQKWVCVVVSGRSAWWSRTPFADFHWPYESRSMKPCQEYCEQTAQEQRWVSNAIHPKPPWGMSRNKVQGQTDERY